MLNKKYRKIIYQYKILILLLIIILSISYFNICFLNKKNLFLKNKNIELIRKNDSLKYIIYNNF
jgi:hypothetical protein